MRSISSVRPMLSMPRSSRLVGMTRPAGVSAMSVRFIVIMLALTLMTLGLAYFAIPGSGSFAPAVDVAAPTPTAPRSE
jgi:hypothetical protein